MVEKGFEWDGNGLPPIVRVEWDDCQGKSGWVSVKKAFELEPAHGVTVGFLLEWTDEALRMSGAAIAEHGIVTEVGNTDVIPAGWVQRVEELRHA